MLVDSTNKVLGSMEKLEAHEKGLLHRAFSGFIFNNKNELLIQQRDLKKYHNGGIWSNTVCSHPYPNESTKHGIKRRIFEEFGFHSDFKKIGEFQYKMSFKNGLTENEYDNVFIAKYKNQKIMPNKNEIMNYKWISRIDLENAIQNNSEYYSYWLKEILKLGLLNKFYK